jgi:quinol monooxygenase YgiN
MFKTQRHLASQLAGAALMLLASSLAAHAQTERSAYVVTYVEVKPSATDEAIALLKNQRQASLSDSGNQMFQLLQRTGRPNQFVILEAWRDADALQAHNEAAHTQQMLKSLDPLQISAFDQRQHTALSVAPAKPTKATLYAITHVDIIPTMKDTGIALVEAFAQASRNDGGNVLFDVLTLNARTNHMTVVEAWESRDDQERHADAAATRAFREKLLPLSGSLYDERLYRVID